MFEVDEVKRTHVTLQIVNLLTYDRDSTKRDFTVDGVTYKARTKKEVTQPKQQEGN